MGEYLRYANFELEQKEYNRYPDLVVLLEANLVGRAPYLNED